MRTPLASIDVMNQRLEDRLEALIARLFSQARYEASTGIYRLGSVHGEEGGSLAIWAKGTKRGQWHDFAAGEGGDLVGLVHKALRHGDWKDTFAWINDFTGHGRPITIEERRAEEKRADEAKAKRAREDQEQRLKLQKSAFRHFQAGVALPGTPVERYLIGRNINMARLGKAPGALRYHAAMRCPETKIERPCMIASMQGPDGRLVTIHRTFLLCHPDGRVTKADRKGGGDMAEAKQAYGAYAGAWIPLWRGETGKPMRQMPDGEWIAVTEGIEDGLTLALASPRQRVVAALSLSNIGGLELPERAGGIYLCADNDANEKARAAFQRAKARLIERGYRVVEFRPPETFKDFNEWGAALAKAARLEGAA